MIKRIASIAVVALLLPLAPVAAQTAADKEAVRQAALDYVEGIYTVDPTRIERSVHKNLTKRGFWREPAAAKIVAMWGIDYMHLAKYDGRWQIINIVWQAHPPKAQATASR